VPQRATVSPKFLAVPTQVAPIVPQVSGARSRMPAVLAQVAPVQTNIMAFLTDVTVIAPDLPVLVPDPGSLGHQRSGSDDQGAGEEEAREQFQAFHLCILE